MVVRFSEAELAVVQERAGLAGLAVGAWIGEVVVGAAERPGGQVGLVDLLQLHADVVAAGLADEDRDRLLARLDAAVDHVIMASRGRL